MLTKWGAALGLASAGRVVAGGGPLGDATVWPAVADWTDFGSIPGPLRTGDLAPVTDLNPGSGMAIYNGTDWELYRALFATKADLDLFLELVAPGAIAIVGTGVETDPIYYSDGTTWFRTPDGSHYIYPNELDWASLPTEDTILNDDEVGVDDLGFAGSSGTAQWHGGNEWRLIDANFTSVADALAFDALYPVHAGAVARIKTAAPFNDRSIVYLYHAGEWERSGVTTTQGYVWTLTQLEAISGADPSGIGAVQEGDFGIVSASGGPILLRYNAACPTAYGSPKPTWMTPIAYAGTPVVQAWTDGTESNVTLAAQGWTIVNDAGCSVTATGGFQRLASAATATVARLRCMIGTIAAATRFETIFEARASTAGGFTLANPFVSIDGTNGTTFGQCGSTGLGFRDFAFGGPLQTPLRNNAAVSLPTLGQTAATCLVRDEGRTVLSSADRDGLPLGNYRRNLQTVAANLAQVAAQGQAGTASTLDYRGQIITY